MASSNSNLISLADVEQAVGDLGVPPGTIITPSARDLAEAKGITFIESEAEVPDPDPSPADSDRSPRDIATAIDHTNLAPGATAAEIKSLCREAVEHGFAAVCVHPVRARIAAGELRGHDVAVCGVVGFPSGAHSSDLKSAEAAQCVADGAREIDVVANSGLLRDGDYRCYADDVAAVRTAIGSDTILKVIIEAALLEDSDIVRAGILAVEGGADFVKTSTGVYSEARLEDVILLRRVLPPEVRIKAAGGITGAESARAFLDAGSDRLGTSSGVAIMWELAGEKRQLT